MDDVLIHLNELPNYQIIYKKNLQMLECRTQIEHWGSSAGQAVSVEANGVG